MLVAVAERRRRMDTSRFSDADLRELALARAPTRIVPGYYRDSEGGPIDERVIRYVVDVFNVLLDAHEDVRPFLDVWRDELQIVYPDGSVDLACDLDDVKAGTVFACFADNTVPLHPNGVTLLEDANGRVLSPRACAERVLAARAREPLPRLVGVVIHPTTDRLSTSTTRLSALQFTHPTSAVVPAHPNYELMYEKDDTTAPVNRHASSLAAREMRGEVFIHRRDGTHIGNHTIHALFPTQESPI